MWLDLPVHVWLPALLRRTLRRIIRSEQLWAGNRETWRGAFWGRESLFGYAAVTYGARRRTFPALLAAYPSLRLRSRAEVVEFLEGFGAR